MRFFASVLVGASALVSLAAAQCNSGLCFTTTVGVVTAGQPSTYEWVAPIDAPVEILLRKGPGSDLTTLETLTTTATGGSYTWTPSDSLVSAADYALEIRQGSLSNYFGPITLVGGAASSAAESSAASTDASSAASSVASDATSMSASITDSSATPAPTGANSTLSTSGRTPTPTGGASQTTGNTAPPANTGAASSLEKPAALLFGVLAAVAFF